MCCSIVCRQRAEVCMSRMIAYLVMFQALEQMFNLFHERIWGKDVDNALECQRCSMMGAL